MLDLSEHFLIPVVRINGGMTYLQNLIILEICVYSGRKTCLLIFIDALKGIRMNLFKLLPLLLLVSCSEKYYCHKTEPRFENRHIYEFTYEGVSRNYIVDDYGVREEGVVNGVYVIFGVNGCCTTVAQYPIKNTVYRVLKDTLIERGTNCIEWKTRGK